ncbi:MAG: ABC transporter permease [Actinomycetota bacterium]
MTALAQRSRLAAIVRRDVAVLRTYQLSLYVSFVQSVVFVFSFYFIGEFVGEPDALADVEGGYFEFALLGVIVTTVIALGLGEFADNISAEQEEGTLEAVLVTPTPLWTLLVGGASVSALLAGVEILLLVGLGFGVLGTAPSAAAMLWSLPLLALTFVCFAAIGIAAAAVIVVVKRGDPLAGPVSQLTGLVSGAYFPVTVLPGWLQPLSELVPATHGLRGIRELTLAGAGPSAIVDDLVILGVMAAVLVPLGLWAFGRAVAAARRAGTLGAY